MYSYKTPTCAGALDFSKLRRTNPHICPGGGVGLDIDRCITIRQYIAVCMPTTLLLLLLLLLAAMTYNQVHYFRVNHLADFTQNGHTKTPVG